MEKGARSLKNAKIVSFVLLTLIWHYYRNLLIFDRSINGKYKSESVLGLRNSRLLATTEDINDGSIAGLNKNIPCYTENRKIHNEGEDESAKVGTHVSKNEKKQKKLNRKEMEEDVTAILEHHKEFVENDYYKCKSCKSQDNLFKRKVLKFFSSINKYFDNTNLDQHLFVNLSLKNKFLRYATYIVPLMFACVIAFLTKSGCLPCLTLAEKYFHVNYLDYFH
ncbi:hypothetical protein AK88_02090 [Plasmodium fragile]|uniref:Uncharacterized protein n=1 Tax=Plasmodium fragile TaxID=5857 RepID=A0A0D9QMP6_PLAFR|nr:uncharacterized protein AK88_02090 [Plasmodium fragile]KJP88309.1 hypothetical protein AK88_02090 [Plasmodium fragile]